MGHRRTGLTRAKAIERLTLWLGLPLLLILLSLTAGIVNYTPVHGSPSTSRPLPANAEAAEHAAPVPSIPIRPDRLVPLPEPAHLGEQIDLGAGPGAS